MGATAYLFNDYMKGLSAGDIALTNEDSEFPASNILDEQIALCARTTNNANIKLQITLGATKALQAFNVGNHNFSGGTFDINSYTASDFSTGKVVVESAKSARLLDVWHRESSAPVAQKYWEFDFSSVTSNDSYLQVGRIMLYDDLVQFTDKEDSRTPRGFHFLNIINRTLHGIRYAHKLAGDIESFKLTWNERGHSGNIQAELRTLFSAVHGDAHPFLYIPDITGTDCYCVYIEHPDLLWQEIMGIGSSAHVGALALELIEAVRGKS